MTNISLPDFKTWAENIINMARQFGTAQDEIERSLEQAYNQGIALGRRQYSGENYQLRQQCSKEYWERRDEK